jgi:hypothetical protein
VDAWGIDHIALSLDMKIPAGLPGQRGSHPLAAAQSPLDTRPVTEEDSTLLVVRLVAITAGINH